MECLIIKSIRKSTGKVFDVHLMISEPIRYIAVLLHQERT